MKNNISQDDTIKENNKELTNDVSNDNIYVDYTDPNTRPHTSYILDKLDDNTKINNFINEKIINTDSYTTKTSLARLTSRKIFKQKTSAFFHRASIQALNLSDSDIDITKSDNELNEKN